MAHHKRDGAVILDAVEQSKNANSASSPNAMVGRMTYTGTRPLADHDIPALIILARASLPDTMASRLGERFAVRYFRALLAEAEVQIDGYFLNGSLVGFIIFTEDVVAALRSAYLKHAIAFTWALLPALLSPTRLAYVVRIAVAVLAGGGEAGDEVRAELLSIGLLREVRGASAVRQPGAVNVARLLVDRACSYLKEVGVTEVKVFCKPEEDEPIANAFVKKEGFQLRGRVTRFGIPTNLYVKSLSPGLPASEPGT